MASVKDTVKYAMLEYPTIFPSVGEVLHHLFAVNGNGYDWVDGELVCGELHLPIDVETIVVGERAKYLSQIEWYKTDPQFEGTDAWLHIEQDLAAYEFRATNIDRFVTDRCIRSAKVGSVYPMSVYADILSIPDDVKDDWLLAAYWFIKNLEYRLRVNEGNLSPDDITWAEIMPDLDDKVITMLINRELINKAAKHKIKKFK
jgi:hypothetical protein